MFFQFLSPLCPITSEAFKMSNGIKYQKVNLRSHRMYAYRSLFIWPDVKSVGGTSYGFECVNT